MIALEEKEMITLPASPKSKKELFRRLKTIMGKEYMILPECKGGHAAPGRMLELLLGSEGRSKNIADCVGVEVKFKKKSTLLTLFHREVDGGDRALMLFFNRYGKVNEEDGLTHFQHTVRNSKLFHVLHQGKRIIVRDKYNEAMEVSWSENRLLTPAIKKLNDLVLVSGQTRTDRMTGIRYVRFDSALRLTGLKSTSFFDAIVRGHVIVDFDARQKAPGSKLLRNHGTKFRIRTNDLAEIWESIQDHTTIDRWSGR